VLRRRVEDAPEVVDARRPIDVESQLRQLQRDVALDPRLHDRVEDADVLSCGGVSLGRGSRAFTQVVEREKKTALGEVLHRDGSRLHRFVGDEASGKPFRRHAVPGRQSLQQLDLRERVK
jgi:hypothetical protein